MIVPSVILICGGHLSFIVLPQCLPSLPCVMVGYLPAILCLFLWMSKVSPTTAHRGQLAPRSHWGNSCCFGKCCLGAAHSLPMWGAPPDSSSHLPLMAQGSLLCTWAETGQRKTEGDFLIERIAFYREWAHAVKFQQIYSGVHVPGIIRRVNRKTIYSSLCVFK